MGRHQKAAPSASCTVPDSTLQVIDCSSPDEVEGEMGRFTLTDTSSLTRPSDRARRSAAERPSLLRTFRAHVLLPDRCLPGQKDIASIVAFSSPVDTLAGLRANADQHGGRTRRLTDRPRLQPHRHPRLAGGYRIQMLDPLKTAESAINSCFSCTIGVAVAPNSNASSSTRRAGSRGPGRPSPGFSSSSSRTTG